MRKRIASSTESAMKKEECPIRKAFTKGLHKVSLDGNIRRK